VRLFPGKAPDNEVDSVYYGCHGVEDGVWRSRDVASFDGTHPVVYIAKGSHGVYPSEGPWARFCCLANDVTSSWGALTMKQPPDTCHTQCCSYTCLCDYCCSTDQQGILWQPKAVLLDETCDARGCKWNRYDGVWDFDGIDSPNQQDWYKGETASSNTCCRRCCLLGPLEVPQPLTVANTGACCTYSRPCVRKARSEACCCCLGYPTNFDVQRVDG